MSTRSPFPYIFRGSDNDWDKVAKEITFMTTALEHTRDGAIQPMPKDDNLKIFKHISTLVTTGEFGTCNGDSAAILNAVSGQVEAHRVLSIVFTCDTNTCSTSDYADGSIRDRQDEYVFLCSGPESELCLIVFQKVCLKVMVLDISVVNRGLILYFQANGASDIDGASISLIFTTTPFIICRIRGRGRWYA